MKNRRTLGLDISTTRTGFCFMNHNNIDYGVIELTTKIKIEFELKTDYQKYQFILDAVKLLLIEYEPELVVIESVYSGKLNYQTSQKLASIGAIVRYHLFEEHIHWIDVPPKSLKKYFTGNGNAKKEDMIQEANSRFKIQLAKKQSDEADAIALSHYGYTLISEE